MMQNSKEQLPVELCLLIFNFVFAAPSKFEVWLLCCRVKLKEKGEESSSFAGQRKTAGCCTENSFGHKTGAQGGEHEELSS